MGISSLLVLETTFEKNQAVDALQEIIYVPAYSRLIFEIDKDDVTLEAMPSRLFTFFVETDD